MSKVMVGEQTEEEAVIQHRFDELRNMGVSVLDANELCERTDIVHQMQDLLDKGCPVKLAAKILR